MPFEFAQTEQRMRKFRQTFASENQLEILSVDKLIKPLTVIINQSSRKSTWKFLKEYFLKISMVFVDKQIILWKLIWISQKHSAEFAALDNIFNYMDKNNFPFDTSVIKRELDKTRRTGYVSPPAA